VAALLRTKFEQQFSRYENELLEVIAPSEGFLEIERPKLETGLGALRRAEADVDALEHRVAEAFPEEDVALRRAGPSRQRDAGG
jgi:hypothetical protein